MKNKSSRKWNQNRFKKVMSLRGNFLKVYKFEAKTHAGFKRMELWNEKTKGK